MKKSIITTLLTFTILSSFSQYDFGIKGAVHNKKLSGNEIIDSPNKPISGFGIDIGCFAMFDITDKLFIQPEVLLSNQLYSTLRFRRSLKIRESDFSTFFLIGYITDRQKYSKKLT